MDDFDAPRSPWWTRPAIWLLIAAAFAFVGLVIFPRMFGFTFLFLPFLWIARPRRRR